MSELRVGATVRGTDKELGRVLALVIDPTNGTVTHLVVSHDALGPRYLVPRALAGTASPDVVELSVDETGFLALDRFDEPNYNEPGDDWRATAIEYEPGGYFLEPFASPLDGIPLGDFERIPKGEVTIRRDDEVVTADGMKVGHVDELLVDPADGHVTHVVLRQGHILRHDEDVVVPIGGATFEEGRVVLGLDLDAVHALEHLPVKRHGHVHEADLG